MASRLTELVLEINEEMRAEGLSLPVPPDTDDEALDREFWIRLERRLVADRAS